MRQIIALAFIGLIFNATAAESAGRLGKLEKQLFAAITSRNIQKLDKALEKGADPEALDERGQPAIIVATQNDFRAGVESLVSAGANPNAVDSGGRTAIFYSVLKTVKNPGFSVSPEYLSSKGAAIDVVDYDLSTPIHYMINMHFEQMLSADAIQTLRRLVRAGFAVNPPDSEGRTPLHRAAWNADSGLARALVELGADVNSNDVNGYTPLMSLLRKLMVYNHYNHEYSGRNHQRVVDTAKAVMPLTYDWSHVANDGRNALALSIYITFAVKGGTIVLGKHAAPHARMARDISYEILKSGADASVGRFVEDESLIATALRYYGSNTTSGYNGSGPYHPPAELIGEMVENATVLLFEDFHLAAQRGLAVALRGFLTRGIHADVRDSAGRTPLMHAVKTDSVESVSLLLDAGACVRVKDSDQNSVIDHYNKGKRNTGVIKLIGDKLADPGSC